MSDDREYERLAAEILQDQNTRITIFTFSVTTTAAVIGLSSQLVPGTETNGILSIVVFAIYSILIPSIILVNHYSRGINCKSEYLRIFHGERWMENFDKLTEEIIPSSSEVTKTHRTLVAIGGYSTENAFRISYMLLSVLVTFLGIITTGPNSYLFSALYLSFLVIATSIAWVFRPISKREYRLLWQKAFEKHRQLASSESPRSTA